MRRIGRRRVHSLHIGGVLGRQAFDVDHSLIRHRRVAGIHPRRFRGRADLPLTDQGIGQADKVARRGRPQFGKGFDVLVKRRFACAALKATAPEDRHRAGRGEESFYQVFLRRPFDSEERLGSFASDIRETLDARIAALPQANNSPCSRPEYLLTFAPTRGWSPPLTAAEADDSYGTRLACVGGCLGPFRPT
jgi:hypothetical protein